MNGRLNTIPVHGMGIAAILGLLLMTHLFCIRPLLRSQEARDAAYAESVALQDAVHELDAQNGETQAQLAEIADRLEQRLTLKTKPGQPVLETMSQLLELHELELMNFREEPSRSASLQKIDIQVSGEYAQALSLIDDIRKLDRPACIRAMQMNALSGDGPLRCSMRLKVEFFPRMQLLATSATVSGT
ncbi:hypothetical protein [Aureliella helgolandensis]|uniref:Pilus assembly protein, PilO n=1 Tax=Aureliella helgolandensis TaxID=2527968 RepID=A0A518GHP8_9BACT|nr:hypothetical protein [Aureliella helgolandensis]QDV28125.1 hypothetical protein Q31a_65200 [Aureliella helgolandensis]